MARPVLGPGGFAMMEGGIAHQFTCRSGEACVLFAIFDRAYDIKLGQGAPLRPYSGSMPAIFIISR